MVNVVKANSYFDNIKTSLPQSQICDSIFNPTLCVNTVFLPIERYWDGLDNPTSFRLVNFGRMKMGVKI